MANALAVLLVIQIVTPVQKVEVKTSASWVNLASSLDEAKNLSTVIVQGHVERVDSAADIVVPARGEPNDVDRVGAEVITLGVDKTYKGKVPGSIALFHTKLESAAESTAPLPKSARPPTNRATPAPPTETETRSVLLDGDPPYQPGERYVLFLVTGPKLRVNGASLTTFAVISPEGRYLLYLAGTDRSDPHLRALTKRGFATAYDGRPLLDLATDMGPVAITSASPAPRNNSGRNSTRNILIGAAAGAILLGTLSHANNGPTPADRAQTTSEGTAPIEAPKALAPGSARETDAPIFQQSTVSLGWRSPARAASRYTVQLERMTDGARYEYDVSGELADAPNLKEGTYRWRVQAIDASNRRGAFSDYRYFRIVGSPSRLR